MATVLDNLDVYARGFWVTLELTLLGFALALVVGTVVVAMRISPAAPVRAAGLIYVEVVRSIPLLVILLLFYFGLTKVGIRFSGFGTAIVAIGLYHGAFVAETLRSGINAVAVGQAEAARSLGLTFAQVLRYVVLPQAFRTVVPPLGNTFVALAKNTSLASVIAVLDLTGQADRLQTELSDAIPIYLGAAVAYLILVLPAGLAFAARGTPSSDHAMSARGSLRCPRPPWPASGSDRVDCEQRAARAAPRLALWRFASRGQLDEARWRPFTLWSTWRFLLVGLRNTVAATVVAGSLAMAAGLGLALLRLSGRRAVRVPTGVWIQFFRGVPLLLLIFFLARFFGQRGIDVPAFWILVLGLTVYNAAVLAEVFRAGILSLDRGQREAAAAIGLRPGQAMRLVVLPQAVRRMLPTLVSQLVILLKDTSLGFVLPYAELLRRGPLHRRGLPGLDPAGPARGGRPLSVRQRCPVPRSGPAGAPAEPAVRPGVEAR